VVGICELCGESFQPKRPEQRFCSIACANKHTARSRHDMSGSNNPMYGKTHSVEAREKIRAARLGKKPSAETRARMSSAHRGKPKTPGWRVAISAALRASDRVNNRGERNPRYKYGQYIDERVYRTHVDLTQCSACGTQEGVMDVHHRDGNHLNNAQENLQVLCHPCHGKLHGRPPGVKEARPRRRRESR